MLVTGTIGARLVVRLAPLGLPTMVTKYGGSALWASMIYWIVCAARPRWAPAHSAIAAICVAVAVELFKLHHTLSLDAFRLTLAGRLLLGRVFSGWDLLAYVAAIGASAWIDGIVRRPGAIASPGGA